MEHYINNINVVSDITYLSELTPAALLRKAKQQGLIRAHNLRRPKFSGLRKLCAHLR